MVGFSEMRRCASLALADWACALAAGITTRPISEPACVVGASNYSQVSKPHKNAVRVV